MLRRENTSQPLRIIALFLSLFSIAILAHSAWAQRPQARQAEQSREEPATKFERFILRKGSVVVREYHHVGSISGESGLAEFKVARAYSPGQRDALIALRVEITEPGTGQSTRTRIGTLDAEEALSLQAALPHIAKMLSALREGKQQHYTEVEFRGGSVTLGFFVSGSGDGSRRNSLFLQAGGEYTGTFLFFGPDKFPQLEKLVNDSVTKIREVQR